MFYRIFDYELIYNEPEFSQNYEKWQGWVKIIDNKNYYMTYNQLPDSHYSAKEMVIIKSDHVIPDSPIKSIHTDKYNINRASEIIKSYEFKKALERL